MKQVVSGQFEVVKPPTTRIASLSNKNNYLFN